MIRDAFFVPVNGHIDMHVHQVVCAWGDGSRWLAPTLIDLIFFLNRLLSGQFAPQPARQCMATSAWHYIHSRMLPHSAHCHAALLHPLPQQETVHEHKFGAEKERVCQTKTRFWRVENDTKARRFWKCAQTTYWNSFFPLITCNTLWCTWSCSFWWCVFAARCSFFTDFALCLYCSKA